MPLLATFKALRPAAEYVRAVAAPPYDVVDLAEANQILAANPLTFLQVEKTGVGLAQILPADAAAGFRRSRENLAKFIADGILLQEPQECFYLYRLECEGYAQLGLVCCLAVDLYENGQIKRHELTRSDKEEDRIRHIETVAAQTGPVLMAYRSRESLDRLLAGLTAVPPAYCFTDHDGVAHTVWVVSRGEDIADIRREFLPVSTLYIADGHHRAAAAVAVARKQRAGRQKLPGQSPCDFMLSVLFPHNQLRILPYNRVVRGLGGLTDPEFLKKVGERFIIEVEAESKTPQGAGSFGLYFRGRWRLLKAKAAPLASNDPVAGIPAQILQDQLLAPILGITEPRLSDRIEFVGGTKGTAALERLVDSGRYDLAFSLSPTSIDDLMRVADAGLLMPPKSTWFEPKLKSGIFTHLLTDDLVNYAPKTT